MSPLDSLLPRPVRRRLWKRRIQKLYDERSYLEAYAAHTDLRVDRDPHSAIGGRWEEMGRLQFDFLVGRGLRPSHRLLDIGCGTLRGGRHFVRYLDPGGYTGLDLSPKAIAYGERLVHDEGLSLKRPRLAVNRDLRFAELDGEPFDFLFAQSVFTHLMPVHIEECFAHVGRLMHAQSRFYFTFWRAKRIDQVGHKRFEYPLSSLASLAADHGLRVDDCSTQYPHPEGQNCALLALAR
ncbi:MAG: class I SAM-dependent methyltransferase [Myxococcales bacterium]|nr:class I SAM-dependent methyltransferase [Myxococcales bacterium]